MVTVLSIVLNSFKNDSRVLKEAISGFILDYIFSQKEF